MGAAAAPMIIGSAIGAAVNRKNPLQGALLGGALGGFGGSFMSGIGAAGSAGTAGATAAEAAAASTAANSALPTAAFTGQSIVPAASSAPFAMNPAGTAALGGISPVTAAGPSTGLIPSSMAPAPSFMDTVTGGIKDLGQFAQQNPVLASMAAQTGMSLLNQQQPSLPPAGLMRGNPSQAQAPQYQVGVPRVSLIQVKYGNYRLHP